MVGGDYTCLGGKNTVNIDNKLKGKTVAFRAALCSGFLARKWEMNELGRREEEDNIKTKLSRLSDVSVHGLDM
jgi:hypothetical protein